MSWQLPYSVGIIQERCLYRVGTTSIHILEESLSHVQYCTKSLLYRCILEGRCCFVSTITEVVLCNVGTTSICMLNGSLIKVLLEYAC